MNRNCQRLVAAIAAIAGSACAPAPDAGNELATSVPGPAGDVPVLLTAGPGLSDHHLASFAAGLRFSTTPSDRVEQLFGFTAPDQATPPGPTSVLVTLLDPGALPQADKVFLTWPPGYHPGEEPGSFDLGSLDDGPAASPDIQPDSDVTLQQSAISIDPGFWDTYIYLSRVEACTATSERSVSAVAGIFSAIPQPWGGIATLQVIAKAAWVRSKIGTKGVRLRLNTPTGQLVGVKRRGSNTACN